MVDAGLISNLIIIGAIGIGMAAAFVWLYDKYKAKKEWETPV